MSDYTPKKAEYKGVKMKSNLEARFAIAFDCMGIKWEYEPTTFWGEEYQGGRYTPDFYLPDFDVYVEVAGVWDERHKHNTEALAKKLDKYIYDKDGGFVRCVPRVLRYNSKGEACDSNGNCCETCGVEITQCTECGKLQIIDTCLSWECTHCGAHDGDRLIRFVNNPFDFVNEYLS